MPIMITIIILLCIGFEMVVVIIIMSLPMDPMNFYIHQDMLIIVDYLLGVVILQHLT